MYTTATSWPASAPTLERSWLLTLADKLAPKDDPIAADPALVMGACGLTPDPWQAELLRADWDEALLLCCRQSGKSTVTAALATWTALYEPGSLILLLSPSLRQSQELFGKVVAAYQALGASVPADQATALQLRLANGSRIVALPGSEKTIRGFSGVTLLVIDEAARVDDTLYFAIRPMLAVSQGKLVALSTPFGRRGWFFDAWENGGADWCRVKVTAYECPRISADFLEEERQALGDWWFRQEYGCVFVDTIDSVFAYHYVMAALSADVQPLWG